MSKDRRFSFLATLLTALLVIAAIGGLNYLVDPLWYAHGNQITGKNFGLNERISKVNLFNRTVDEKSYDCLILGSSRLTMLRPSLFEGMKCFNFSLKGAEAPEQLAYARHAKEAGMKPKVVYVGVDEFNFVDQKITEERATPKVEGSPSAWHAWFSADVLVFTVMTLANIYRDPNYYDSKFDQHRAREFAPWEPNREDKENYQCSHKALEEFRAITKVFPDARYVGFQTLMSPWGVLSDVHSRQLLDCKIDAMHELAQVYDAFYDYAIPSPVASDNSLTYDGSHYAPEAYDSVASHLQGKGPDIAIDVKSMGRDEYRTELRKRLKAFATEHDALDLWNAK